METQCNNEQRRWQMNLSGQQREKATTFIWDVFPVKTLRGYHGGEQLALPGCRRFKDAGSPPPPSPPLTPPPSRGSCFITSPSRSTLCVTVMAQNGRAFLFLRRNTHTRVPFFFSLLLEHTQADAHLKAPRRLILFYFWPGNGSGAPSARAE